MEKATFGAGCFWGVEAIFRDIPGVTDTAVGYAGGHTEQPSYEDVCSHTTGHAEVVEVTFDPAVVEYGELVRKFFAIHDPTQLNRQGPDVGDQYRSVIFTHSDAQEAQAHAILEELEASHTFDESIVTQIEPAPPFWRAEEYHQRYLEKHGRVSCHI